MLQRLTLVHMEDDSDLDTSSEPEDESDQESVPESDDDTNLPKNL